ncbi:MAG: hypothetical protein MUP94_04945 [Flavobacteriales bacterium]|jgi:hypothetical protein|nr:hypothetical protein [Flavobacteriales bacterium]
MKRLNSPFIRFLCKGIIGALCMIATLTLLDQSHLFDDVVDQNGLEYKRWAYLHDMAENEIPLDLVILGNSHAYTGINPGHLSAALGVNAFVLANAGTYVADHYWNLVELLEIHSPKTVVLETYGINDFSREFMHDTRLVNQLRSFNARRNLRTKWKSVIPLFPIDHWGIAMSPTLRNHHYLWTGFPEESKIDWVQEKRYLGRFIRFTSGLQDSTLQSYAANGFAVQGREQLISDESRKYVQKIHALCEARGINLMLLTLPMYELHVNEPESWIGRYDSLALAMSIPYLEFQTKSDLSTYPEYFENTRSTNQHMTFEGSVRASDELAQFIDSHFPESTHLRENEAQWQEFHSGNAGYYRYNFVFQEDSLLDIVAENLELPEMMIKQITAQSQGNTKSDKIITVHVTDYTGALDISSCDLKLSFNYVLATDSIEKTATLRVPQYHLIQREHFNVFQTAVIPLEIIKLTGVTLSPKKP